MYSALNGAPTAPYIRPKIPVHRSKRDSACSEEVRTDIDDEIAGHPAQHREEPVERIVGRIRVEVRWELAFREHEAEADRVAEIDHDERHVQAGDEPRDRPISGRIPARIDGPELVPPEPQ